MAPSPNDNQMGKEETKDKPKCNKLDSTEEMKDDRSEQHRKGKQMHNEPESNGQTKNDRSELRKKRPADSTGEGQKKAKTNRASSAGMKWTFCA